MEITSSKFGSVALVTAPRRCPYTRVLGERLSTLRARPIGMVVDGPFGGQCERLTLTLMNADGQILSSLHLVGTANGVEVPFAALADAIANRGVRALALSHCHPSGDPRPSFADIAATRDVWRLSRLLGGSLLDHVITARGGRFSFRDAGLL